MAITLDFEKPIAELEIKLAELRQISTNGEVNIVTEVKRLQEKIDKLIKKSYQNLTPWQKVQVARHPERPPIQVITWRPSLRTLPPWLGIEILQKMKPLLEDLPISEATLLWWWVMRRAKIRNFVLSITLACPARKAIGRLPD